MTSSKDDDQKREAVQNYVEWLRETPEFKKAYEDLLVEALETGNPVPKERIKEIMSKAMTKALVGVERAEESNFREISVEDAPPLVDRP